MILPSAAPFALGDGPDACLLLHGLTGSPGEVRPVGEALARAGMRAIGPCLPGHGGVPEDLAEVGRRDLLEAARGALRELRGARRVFLVGLSAGALLCLRLAATARVRDGVPPPDALALLAPAVRFAGSTWAFTQVLGRLPLPPLVIGPLVIGKGARDVQLPLAPDATASPESPSLPAGVRADGSYSAIPLRWGRELRLLADEALADARRVRAPTLLLHGALDGTASPAGSRLLASRLASARVELRIFPETGHVMPVDRGGLEVCAAVVEFFESLDEVSART